MLFQLGYRETLIPEISTEQKITIKLHNYSIIENFRTTAFLSNFAAIITHEIFYNHWSFSTIEYIYDDCLVRTFEIFSMENI